jgi:uncharacterized protein (TIRG00374 family)
VSSLYNWRDWRLLLGLLLSAVCLWLALRRVPLSEMGRVFERANTGWLLAALLVQIIAVAARAWRWVVILRGAARFSDSFWAQSIGYLFTNIFPLRLGEMARIVVLAERSQLPVMRVAASAMVERLLDVATIVVALLLVLPWMEVPPLVARAGLFFGAICLMAFAALLLAVRYAETSTRLIGAILARLKLPAPRVTGWWQELLVGLAPMSTFRAGLSALLWSALTWIPSIAMYFSVIRAFEPRGTWLEATFTVVALSFAVTVPSSPGFIGVFQLAGQQALVLPFGSKYTAASALTITLTAHLIYYLLTTALGVAGLARVGASLAQLGRKLSPTRRPEG